MSQFRPLLAAAPQPATRSSAPAPQTVAQRRPKQQRNYHKDSDWESRKSMIARLYIDEDKKVEEVISILAGQGFKAR